MMDNQSLNEISNTFIEKTSIDSIHVSKLYKHPKAHGKKSVGKIYSNGTMISKQCNTLPKKRILRKIPLNSKMKYTNKSILGSMESTVKTVIACGAIPNSNEEIQNSNEKPNSITTGINEAIQTLKRDTGKDMIRYAFTWCYSRMKEKNLSFADIVLKQMTTKLLGKKTNN